MALHAAAAAAAAMVVPGTPGVALAGVLMALGLAAAWSRALLRSAGSVRAIEIGGETVVLELAGGARIEAQPAGRRYVSRLAVALRLARPARQTVLISADMLDAAGFRRLRIWALWAKLPPVAAKRLQG